MEIEGDNLMLEHSTKSYVDSTLTKVLPGIRWSSYVKAEDVQKFKQDLNDMIMNLDGDASFKL